MTSYFFYFLAAVLIFASLCVVLARNPLYNVLSLVLSIFALSSLFVLLEAYFVGMILLLVYAGAVLIFFLFVVMCLNLNAQNFTSANQNRFKLLGIFAGIMYGTSIYWAIKSAMAVLSTHPSSLRGTIEVIGKVLFTQYLLPFELTSLLLLIAVFGIVALAQGVLFNGRKSNK